eukprot:TRINITY_DN5066_c4_g1_i1.p1 TRINITY_DN5066_c4_g1~~TRINITY_DN5066_c4_g1_i1.p1  ORF type:complete len:290 (+),score=47.65 TRINITY_DN5066_c4_g1_i1:14-883(+)
MEHGAASGQFTDEALYGCTEQAKGSNTYGAWQMRVPPLVRYPLLADGRLVIIHQNHTGVGELGTHLWDSSLGTSRYVEALGKEYFTGKRTIELGSGTGLCGLVAACVGADIVLTDKSTLLPMLTHNINANSALWDTTTSSPCKAPTAREVLWGVALDKQGDVTPTSPPLQQFDVVLGSDLTYDYEVLPPLLHTMRELVADSGEIILSYGKHRSVMPVFLQLAEQLFTLEHVNKTDIPPHKELKVRGAEFWFLNQIAQPIRIVRMRPRPGAYKLTGIRAIMPDFILGTWD